MSVQGKFQIAEVSVAIFERALKIWGLDLDKGDAMWQLYADYYSSDAQKLAGVTRRRCAQAIRGSQEIFDSYAKSEKDAEKLERTQTKHEASLPKLFKLEQFDA